MTSYLNGEKIYFKRFGKILEGEIVGTKKTFFGTRYLVKYQVNIHSSWDTYKTEIIKLISSRKIICVRL